MFSEDDHKWMQHAIHCAEKAADLGEVPVGAVLVLDNNLIAEGWNFPITHSDPTAHAEIIALREAGKILNNYRLTNATLYVTLEPCIMCVGAMTHARIKRVVYGATDPKAGAVQSIFKFNEDKNLNHRIQYAGGLFADKCGDMLRDFFQQKR